MPVQFSVWAISNHINAADPPIGFNEPFNVGDIGQVSVKREAGPAIREHRVQSNRYVERYLSFAALACVALEELHDAPLALCVVLDVLERDGAVVP